MFTVVPVYPCILGPHVAHHFGQTFYQLLEQPLETRDVIFFEPYSLASVVFFFTNSSKD